MTLDEPRPPEISLAALFARFLRFGVLAFGGPVAQIAMVRHELIEREHWMSGPRFNRLLAVMQALPGPEAHELCVHLGMRARGRVGGLLAGLGFMLPGFALMTLAAWAYFRFDVDRGAFAAGLLGAQAAVIGLIARAVHRIGAHVLVSRALWVIGGVSFIATLAGAPFWLVLPAAGAAHMLARAARRGWALVVLVGVTVAALAIWRAGDGGGGSVEVPAQATLASITLLFVAGLKAGLLTFGGAYTAIPFVRQDVVGRGWVDDGTFLDGVTLANVLPAPLVIFATFAGYAAAGLPGALVMTAGVFLPAFAFSLIFYERLEAIVEAPRIRAVLDGVAAAVVGVIVATLIGLAATLARPGAAMGILAAIALVATAVAWVSRSRFAPPIILAAAAIAGLVLLPAD